MVENSNYLGESGIQYLECVGHDMFNLSLIIARFIASLENGVPKYFLLPNCLERIEEIADSEFKTKITNIRRCKDWMYACNDEKVLVADVYSENSEILRMTGGSEFTLYFEYFVKDYSTLEICGFEIISLNSDYSFHRLKTNHISRGICAEDFVTRRIQKNKFVAEVYGHRFGKLINGEPHIVLYKDDEIVENFYTQYNKIIDSLITNEYLMSNEWEQHIVSIGNVDIRLQMYSLLHIKEKGPSFAKKFLQAFQMQKKTIFGFSYFAKLSKTKFIAKTTQELMQMSNNLDLILLNLKLFDDCLTGASLQDFICFSKIEDFQNYFTEKIILP